MMNSQREQVISAPHSIGREWGSERDREVSFDYDDIGFGESDDEVGDDEQPKGTGNQSPT